MTERTKLGFGVLEAALLLGVLGDALLRSEPWGLNLFLWIGVLSAATLALARMKRVSLGGDGRWLLPAAVALAAACAWRDSTTLKVINVLLLLVLLSLLMLRARRGRIRLAGIADYVLAGVMSGVNAVFGPFLLLFQDIGWKELPRDGWTRHAMAVLRGLAIAAPLVLVFGGLFMAADAIYDGLVRNTLGLDVERIASHVALFAFIAWVSAGFLRGAFLGPERAWVAGGGLPAHVAFGFERKPSGVEWKNVGASANSSAADAAEARKAAGAPQSVGSVTDFEGEAAPRVVSVTEEGAEGAAKVKTGDAQEGQGVASEATTKDGVPGAKAEGSGAGSGAGRLAQAGAGGWRRKASLGIVEVGIVLGVLNALFFSFVAVQLRYFFGGASVVLSSEGLTYAQYARRGFFELVWVAALVLPLLLAAHWLLRKENPAHERVFRALAAGMLLMLFVIMASALGRMRLYQSEYGQTELRLYTTAFMGWLAVVFVWFALTVLRGERERFACGALVAALFIVGGLHVINPNANIVRTNAALAVREGRNFDALYASSLGADAVPALLAALPGLNPPDRRVVAARLLEWWEGSGRDWRSWNWSRTRAQTLVRENEAMLREWARNVPADEATRADAGRQQTPTVNVVRPR